MGVPFFGNCDPPALSILTSIADDESAKAKSREFDLLSPHSFVSNRVLTFHSAKLLMVNL